MQRPNFRPRPIDVNKKLPVVRSARELDQDETINAQLHLSGATGRAAEEEEEEWLLQEALAVVNDVKPANLPIPEIIQVELYELDVPATFVRPQNYLRYKEPTPDEIDATCLYECDTEDEAFLKEIGAQDKKGSGEQKLESVIDRLEKESFKLGVMCTPSAIEGKTSVRPSPLLTSMYEYWSKKRQKRGRALIRRFQAPTSMNDPSPLATFRPRERERKGPPRTRQNDSNAYNRIRSLRMDFDRVRTLLSLVIQREKLKKDLVDLSLDLQMSAFLKDFDPMGALAIMREQEARMRRRSTTAIENPKGAKIKPKKEREVRTSLGGGLQQQGGDGGDGTDIMSIDGSGRDMLADRGDGVARGGAGGSRPSIGGGNAAAAAASAGADYEEEEEEEATDDIMMSSLLPAEVLAIALQAKFQTLLSQWDPTKEFDEGSSILPITSEGLLSGQQGTEEQVLPGRRRFPFCGRPRLGRGGRVIFDRCARPPPSQVASVSRPRWPAANGSGLYRTSAAVTVKNVSSGVKSGVELMMGGVGGRRKRGGDGLLDGILEDDFGDEGNNNGRPLKLFRDADDNIAAEDEFEEDVEEKFGRPYCSLSGLVVDMNDSDDEEYLDLLRSTNKTPVNGHNSFSNPLSSSSQWNSNNRDEDEYAKSGGGKIGANQHQQQQQRVSRFMNSNLRKLGGGSRRDKHYSVQIYDENGNDLEDEQWFADSESSSSKSRGVNRNATSSNAVIAAPATATAVETMPPPPPPPVKIERMEDVTATDSGMLIENFDGNNNNNNFVGSGFSTESAVTQPMYSSSFETNINNNTNNNKTNNTIIGDNFHGDADLIVTLGKRGTSLRPRTSEDYSFNVFSSVLDGEDVDDLEVLRPKHCRIGAFSLLAKVQRSNRANGVDAVSAGGD